MTEQRAIGVFFLKLAFLLGLLGGDMLHDAYSHGDLRGRALLVWVLLVLWAILVYVRDYRRAVEAPGWRNHEDARAAALAAELHAIRDTAAEPRGPNRGHLH